MPIVEQKYIDPFSPLEILARQVVEGFITGLHKSPFHGFSVEFAEHRLYNPGESTRHIDWKLYGKTEKLFVKRYEEETNLRCQLIIDNSSSMYFPVIDKVTVENPNKATFSVYCAAAIMHMLRQQRDAAGLSLFSSGIELQTRCRSSNVHYKFLYSELEKLLDQYQPEQKRLTSAAKALHEIAEAIHRRSLVVLFSDMFDTEADPAELFDALQHLRYNKHEVIFFHVVDQPGEIEFDYDNRPHRFIDMESGEVVRLNPNEIREEYKARLTSFQKELKVRCDQYHIDFVEANIRMGFRQVLLPYLVKRQKMK
ncbi:MAG TPA: DUF58 domain-containing protein [Bacteroidales bacterium]|nr:DUF58 domain-containing protein [Bacteroidales bacterium]HRZ48365.1 DUF58 domain-containing protein [Bacteroidales bacterium]